MAKRKRMRLSKDKRVFRSTAKKEKILVGGPIRL